MCSVSQQESASHGADTQPKRSKGVRLIVPLSTFNRISLLKIQQASNIIYVEHSSAFWLPSERIMLQASCLQPTGQLNLDLPNNGTKIHSCVNILRRRHGKTWLISYSPNHLWCINKALVLWHSNNQGLHKDELIKCSSLSTKCAVVISVRFIILWV